MADFDGPRPENIDSKSIYDGSLAEVVEAISEVGYVDLGEMMEHMDKQKFVDLLSSKIEDDVVRFPTIALRKKGEEPKIFMIFSADKTHTHKSLWGMMEKDGKTKDSEVLFASSFEIPTAHLDSDQIVYLTIPDVKMIEGPVRSNLYVPMGRVSDQVRGYPFVEKYVEKDRDGKIFRDIFEPAGIGVVIKY